MTPSVRLLASLSLALGGVAAQAQNSPATPPTTMPQSAPSYSPPDAMPNAVADAAITTSLSSEFGHDVDLAPLKLNVASSEGNVSVHGIVPSDELRDRAIALASRVRGVKSVESDLIVQP